MLGSSSWVTLVLNIPLVGISIAFGIMVSKLASNYLERCESLNMISSDQKVKNEGIAKLIIISYMVMFVIVLIIVSLVNFFTLVRLKNLMKFYTLAKMEKERFIVIGSSFADTSIAESIEMESDTNNSIQRASHNENEQI